MWQSKKAFKNYQKKKETWLLGKQHFTCTRLQQKVFFIFCVCLIAKYSALLEPVVYILQGKTLDLVKCTQHIKQIISVITDHRAAAKEHTKELVDEATEIGEALDVELCIPRVVGKQQYRSNPSATNLTEYFKRSIFIPHLDSFINSLENRFSDDKKPAFALHVLHPYLMNTLKELKIVTKDIAAFYNIRDLPIETELWFSLWKNKDLQKEELKALDLVDVLKETEQLFPHTRQALMICLAQPCTTATIERAFSTLRRVKTWLRSTMIQDRLNGLCMLSVHRKLVQHDKFCHSSQKTKKLCLV
ncbi:hypothetical protein NQ318_010513 [Aromia moschata]|uniref:HAT C-terminal dimerisation domain-containing protein n=1 Tax=Aromia moschata TaxID=1265417 RepID=A0AAV8YG63_9CUCU|nr:hypothetical protein NQ318_010513 [Aromia moschata]